MIRVEVIYAGRVQGVGFRATVIQIAGRYAVMGFVRNLADGCVEVIAEGMEAVVEAFLAEVRERMRRNIRDESIHRAVSTGQFQSFDVR